MITTFNCTRCNATVELESETDETGTLIDCPICKELVAVPDARGTNSLATQVITKHPKGKKEPSKTAEDYAADAICATAKAGWKATKFVAPIVARVALKVTAKGVKAASDTKAGKWLAEPSAKPPTKVEQTKFGLMMLWRFFGG